MINGLEGIPGAGKSYEATVYHVLETLKEGVKVITNLPLVVEMFHAIDPRFSALIELRRRPQPIRGTWNAARMDDDGNGKAFELFADGHTEEPADTVHVFGHVWDYYSGWRHPVTGRGPLFVIDECHVPLPKVGTDPQVVQWFKLHRHFNANVLLMTQNFRDMCNGIATLLGVLIRCRSADFLGKKGEYVRKVYAGFRGALVSHETRKYIPEFFPLYKSHTQGKGVAESGFRDVVPFVVKWRRFTIVWFIGSALLITWLFWPKAKAGPKVVPVVHSVSQTASVPAAVPAAVASAAKVAASAAGPQEDPEPLDSKGIHLKGRVTMGARVLYVFVVSQNGQPIETFTDAELLHAGYVFRPLGECMGTLEWKGRLRPISCDLPTVTMVNERKS